MFKVLLKILCLAQLCLCPLVLRADEGRYRIGVIIPLSGQVASLGHYVRRGVELALRELPPGERQAIEVVFEDDQFDPKKTISAYNRLSQQGRLDAVFVIGSPPANALAPLTERNKQVLIAVGGSDPNIVKDRSYAFVHWVIPPILGLRLVDELLRRDFKRLAFVCAEATGALADVNAAISALHERGAGGRIVYNEAFAKDETDYRAALGAIKTRQADAVVVVLFPGALSSFARQFRQLKLDAELIGMETFEDEAEVKAAAGALLGTWYVNASDPTADFVERYKQAFGEHPGWASANGYDALRLTAAGARRGAGDNGMVRDHLAGLKDYHGAAGKYSASGDNRFLLPAALKRITKDGFVGIAQSD